MRMPRAPENWDFKLTPSYYATTLEMDAVDLNLHEPTMDHMLPGWAVGLRF